MVVTEPPRTLEDLPLPRRAAVVELLGEILATERALADLYERVAARADAPALRRGLEELARAKRAQIERLAPLARLVPEGPVPSPDAGRPDGAGRAEAFLAASQRERRLEVLYREIDALLAGAPPTRALRDAAGWAARHRSAFRSLYLRYS